ncbi:ZIP metal ion transporter family [Striga asiatica]|uniref:ZIP metal ion transporter family n=1 Tax=Striga asiatica TaxID=4170 RepID=A0A5A7PQ74_STRAF|nr:ZIP metal ion transporter family [Striga asiatica]
MFDSSHISNGPHRLFATPKLGDGKLHQKNGDYGSKAMYRKNMLAASNFTGYPTGGQKIHVSLYLSLSLLQEETKLLYKWGELPVVAGQRCLLHMYKLEHILQIILVAHCYKGNHGHHITSGILQCRPVARSKG